MLRELHIAGLGVIEDLDLELHPGLNVLTGETGAGKTMVTVGLALALGARGSPSLVRRGSGRARVEARFDAPPTPATAEWAEDGEVVLARTISEDGRGSARVGGQIVPVSTLATLAPELVEIHGQGQHQRLLSAGAQTRFLDRFAGRDHMQRVARYSDAHDRLREVRASLGELDRAARDREREKDLLAYQVREIEAAALRPGELSTLAVEEARLSHAERLLDRAQVAEAALTSEEGGVDALREAAAAVAEAAALDPGAGDLAARLQEAAEEAAELGRAVRAYRESVDLDPDRLEAVRERIHALRALERKYGDGEEGILAYLARARDRLASLLGTDDERGALGRELEELVGEAERLAGEVSAGRARAAPGLRDALGRELRELGMEGASVEVVLRPQEELGPGGRERVEILFSAGPGQPPLPLARVASGGELSRTMLACRSVLADLDDVPTLVFDEVDAGIGGRAGLAVGRRLARLATSRQVLVVTHLPQIACFADRHIRVEKRGGTATVQVLDEAGRVAEVSRMLSGLPESEAAATHAEELLSEAARGRGSGRAGRRAPR